MRTGLLGKALPVLIVLALATAAAAQPHIQRLMGVPGVDQDHGSGYLDLKPIVSFHAGERLRIHVGGTAARVVVRLLPRGSSPDSANIIVSTGQVVPPGRVLDVALTQDYPNILQVSVHGGPAPWNLYPLGAHNGPATLLSVDRLR